MMSRNRLIQLTGTGLLCVASVQVYATGFTILEQSANAQANAYAGAGSAGTDASTIFYNPAAMTKLSKAQVVLSLQQIMPEADFLDSGSNSTGTPLTGGNSESGESILAPNLYASYPINNDLVVGVGVSTPYGFNTEYDPAWVGRYHAIHSELKSMSITPAFAYRVREKLSLGIALWAINSDIDLTNAMDFGLLTTGSQTDDGLMSFEGDNWDYGYQLGLLWEPGDGTQVGLTYRSKVSQALEGTLDYSASSAATEAAAIAAGFVDSSATTDAALPASFGLSIFSKATDTWDVMFDVSSTSWDFKGFEIAPTTGNNLTPYENWDFTIRLAMGLNYHYDDKLTLKGGIAWDQSPVQNAEYRNARIPDSDQQTLALGLAYKLTDALNVNGGYTHIFSPDGNVNNTDAYGHQLVGHYQTATDILGAQLTWTFQ